MFNKYRIHMFPLIIGVIVGYFVFHPYNMLMSYVIHIYHGGEIHWNLKDLYLIFLSNFEFSMLPMAIAFALLGGIISLLTSIIVDRKRHLYALTLENEKRQVALETLKRLMVTLSHYLLNANVVIGGKARHSRKIVTDKDVLASLDVIEEQAKKIDSVISVLKKVTKIKTSDYTPKGHDLMIDISKEIEEQLNKKTTIEE
ncbi:MAG: hypothetical protein ACYSR0_10710 [Planctomycetota bacterium]|jgi:hypothetical protein